MPITSIPYEEWFVNRPEALDFLNEVARELHWLTSNGREFERIRHLLPIHHVRATSGHSWDENCCYYKCCDLTGNKAQFEFNFEMTRGRPGLGHVYLVTLGDGFVQINRAGRIDSGYNPTIIEKPIGQIEGYDLHAAILLMIVEDAMIT